MEVVIAAALGMEPAVEELAYRLCPEVHQAFNSDTFSKCLKRDSHKHIGQTIGISDLRDLQSNIVSKHRDPEALVIKNSDDTCDLQQGHTTMVANASYNLTPDRLQGVREDTIKAYRRASHWWQHITGMWNTISIGSYFDIVLRYPTAQIDSDERSNKGRRPHGGYGARVVIGARIPNGPDHQSL